MPSTPPTHVLQQFASSSTTTHRLIEFSVKCELFFAKLDEIENGRELIAETFGFGRVQVTPRKLVISTHNKQGTQGFEKSQFVKIFLGVQFGKG